jgi:hypothetical protein
MENFINKMSLISNIKMVKKLVICLVILFLVFPIASALDTEIKIQTLADHKVWVYIYPAGEATAFPLKTFSELSPVNGEVVFTYKGSVEIIDTRVKVTKDGENILPDSGTKFFGSYDAGSPIYIRYDFQVSDGDYGVEVEPEEEVEEEVEEVVEEVVEEEVVEEVEDIISNDGEITGEVVSGDIGGITRVAYYILGALVLLTVIFFVVRRFVTIRTSTKSSNLSSSNLSSSDLPRGEDAQELEKIEQQIEAAKKELSMLKNKEKIKEAEEKIRKDQEELSKLRSGED